MAGFPPVSDDDLPREFVTLGADGPDKAALFTLDAHRGVGGHGDVFSLWRRCEPVSGEVVFMSLEQSQ